MAISTEVQVVVTGKDNASKEIKAVSSSIRDLASEHRAALAAIGGAVAGLGTLIVGFGIKSAASFEQNRISFETLLGSASAAKRMLKDLSDFAARTPFTLPDVVQGSQQLLAMGFAAENVIPIFKDIGNVAAGLGKGADGLQRIILNLGQVQAQGKLTGRELRDFNIQTVPLVEELARMFGVTSDEINQMTEDSQISSEAVIQAFHNMSNEGGKFADLMEKQSHSLSGIFSNLQDEIGRTARSLVGISEEGDIRKGSIFFFLKIAAEQLLPILAMIRSINPSIAAGFIVLATAAGGLLLAAAGLGIVLPAVATGLAALKVAAMGLVTFALSPIGLLLIGIVAILGFFTFKALQAAMATDGVKDAMGDLNKVVPKVGESVKKMSRETRDALNDLSSQVSKSIRNFDEALAGLVKSHQDRKKEIEKQLLDEKQAFAETQRDIEDRFGESTNDLKDKRDEQVSDLQGQLDAELNKLAFADQAKVNKLQQRIAKENQEYEKQFGKLQTDRDSDIAEAQAKLDKKSAILQDQLNQEVALLEKHKNSVLAVRGTQLLDEFEMLQRSHREELQEFDKQKGRILTNANQTVAGINGEFGKIGDGVSLGKIGDQIGKDMASAFVKAFRDEVGKVFKTLKDNAKLGIDFFTMNVKDFNKKYGTNIATNAMGTDSWKGGPTWVGERGPEIVTPPAGSKITANHDLSKGMGSAFNVTVNVGTMIASDTERRNFAELLMRDLENIASMKGKKLGTI